jgi:hypothetical protein
MRIAVVTGNPEPASRTHGVALAVADTLRAALVPSARSAPKVLSSATPGVPAPLVVDLAEHAPALFDSSDAELIGSSPRWPPLTSRSPSGPKPPSP